MAEDETPRAFRAFTAYRDAGPSRSLAAVATALADAGTPLSRRQIGALSSRFGWVERARAFDADDAATRLRERRAASMADDLAAYTARQRDAARDLAALADDVLAVLQTRVATLPPEAIRPQDVPRYLDAALRLRAAADNVEAQSIGLNELVALLDGDGLPAG